MIIGMSGRRRRSWSSVSVPLASGRLDVEEDGTGALGSRRRVSVYRGPGEASVITKPIEHFSDDVEERGFIIHHQHDGTHSTER